MFVKLCGCPREEICQERICKSSWQRRDGCAAGTNIRAVAKKKAARVVRRGTARGRQTDQPSGICLWPYSYWQIGGMSSDAV